LSYVVYLLVKCANFLIYAELMMMLLRVLLSLFRGDEESGFLQVLYALTEPIVLPARIILSRIEAVRELPIDIPFLVTALTFSFLPALLPAVYI